jgi:hypothetical protein
LVGEVMLVVFDLGCLLWTAPVILA